jgi:hypothetical protein
MNRQEEYFDGIVDEEVFVDEERFERLFKLVKYRIILEQH